MDEGSHVRGSGGKRAGGGQLPAGVRTAQSVGSRSISPGVRSFPRVRGAVGAGEENLVGGVPRVGLVEATRTGGQRGLKARRVTAGRVRAPVNSCKKSQPFSWLCRCRLLSGTTPTCEQHQVRRPPVRLETPVVKARDRSRIGVADINRPSPPASPTPLVTIVGGPEG